MALKNKYEQYYREGRDVCGPPFPEFVKFFNDYPQSNAAVLDLGCGQGRDALFIARKGHFVVGVDLSPTGVAQMLADAQKKDLNIEGVVADIVAYEPDRNYDIVILDRVLHMLSDDGSRTAVLEKVCSHTKPGGFVLIADTPKQKPFLNAFFDNQGHNWQRYWQRKNFLFMQNSQD